MAYSESAVTEFYKYLSGERQAQLTPVELIEVFRTPPSPELLAAYRVALIPPYGTATQKLDPDVALVSSIASSRTREYLLPIAYALRGGANANLYVATPKVGIIHVLAFAINELGLGQNPVDSEILTSVVALLILSGARANMTVFNSYHPGDSNFGAGEQRVSQTVLDWARSVIPKLQLDEIVKTTESLDPLFRIRLGILLNRPDLVPAITADDEEHIFRSQSYDILPRLTPAFLLRNDPRRTPPLANALKYFFPEGYEYVVKAGMIPSFTQINDLLLELQRAYTSHRQFLVPLLSLMLLNAIASGASMSSEQLAFLKTLSAPLTEEVIRISEVPLWEKICRTPEGTLPKEFVPMLLALGYDPLTPKRILCDDLKLLSQTPPETLIRAAESRQHMRISSMLGRPSEFVMGTPPNLPCSNKNLLSNDPLLYPDFDIAFYRDSAGKVWCFTCDMFENLLSDNRNPYSGADLPPHFIDKLRAQVRIRNMYNLGVEPVLFETILRRMLEKDPLPRGGSYRDTEAFRTLITLASTHGISQTEIENMSNNQLISLSQGFEPGVKYDGLPKSLRLETFARIVTDGLRRMQQQNKNAVNAFFNGVQEHLRQGQRINLQ